jgi:multidrug resistance protein, MATE family
MSAPTTVPVSHRGVLSIAVPIMLSNVTEPLIGVVNTAVIGQLPEPYYIGAIALGALIFSFVYWGFGFLRLGTGGFTAQAVGAGDRLEIPAILVRNLMIAVVCGLGLVALSPLLIGAAIHLLEGSPEMESHIRAYFFIRIFSAPFALANFCFLGWFTGQGHAKLGFAIQIFLNLTNAGLNALFVLHFGMTSGGVALGTLIAEIAAALLGLALAIRHMRAQGLTVARVRLFDRDKLRLSFAVNRDIMIRTVCLVFGFAWFAARGAKLGDVTVAANTVLLHLFEVSAYLIDGFAYATETLVGQAAGARDLGRYERATRIAWVWALATGGLCCLAVLIAGPAVIDLLTVNAGIRAEAREFLPWVAACVLTGTVAFQYDGIYTGLMATAAMRNMMVLSLGAYLAISLMLEPRYGNAGLWTAFAAFFILRGTTFAMATPSVKRRAFGAVP